MEATALYALSLHDALPISSVTKSGPRLRPENRAEPLSVTELFGATLQPSPLSTIKHKNKTEPFFMDISSASSKRAEWDADRSEEHTSELQSHANPVRRLPH